MTYKALQTSLDFANPHRPGANDPAIGGPAGLSGQAQPIEVVVSLPLSCLPLVERRDEFAATPCPTDQTCSKRLRAALRSRSRSKIPPRSNAATARPPPVFTNALRQKAYVIAILTAGVAAAVVV
ncbi:hypothetical protein [Mycobacterium riyadhense]|uniref:hypothetical protein n=1 Tax=Mycobacterium riyadhense TaxID=486698 RepID=UPI00195DD8C2|nr:hypothetical protein [Mycobacterium riyadhense]